MDCSMGESDSFPWAVLGLWLIIIALVVVGIGLGFWLL